MSMDQIRIASCDCCEEYRPLYYGTAAGGIETWACFECHGWDCDPYEGGDDETNPLDV